MYGNQFRQQATSPVMTGIPRSQGGFLEKSEEWANSCLQRTKHILPHLGRIFLCSTFIEDGFRMFHQWGEQRDYINNTWNCGWFLAVMFVLINLTVQIGASLMVIARKQVQPACYSLFCIVFLQTFAYSILWDLKFLARSLSLVGAILLLLAENQKEKGNVFHNMPMMDDPSKTTKNYMQLAGRLLLVLMFITLLKFNMNPLEIFRNLVGITLIVVIAIGFKTKLMSVVMILWLLTLNFFFNNFWKHRSTSIMYDFKKYDFFQTMTVVGGLIILIIIGPGGLSVDEKKKMY